MATKQQIEKEAAAYTNENAGSGFEFQAFVTGAEWAAEQMQAENAELRARLESAIKVDQFDQYRDEVAKAVKGLLAENERLKSAMSDAIKAADMVDDESQTVFVMVEILKNALK